MYKHNGVDPDGLDLWLRRRGSRAENFHQKMKVAAGPFGFGVETFHYLQVLLAYFYNISAGINRCGEPDFGHFMLHLEDRIQIRMQQIWAVDLFTNRINVLEHEPLDFWRWVLDHSHMMRDMSQKETLQLVCATIYILWQNGWASYIRHSRRRRNVNLV